MMIVKIRSDSVQRMVALRGTRRVAIPLAATIILAWFAVYGS
jgi:hypothetical protein